MKQIIQDLKSGKTILEEVPAPQVQAGQVLIMTHRSLVSLGTERMLVEFGKANWIDKARQQPEKVKQVLDKVKTDGLQPTMDAVFRKLGEPLPLGYCNAGVVIGVGAGVTEFKIGDRVVSNGHHAEIVSVPKNLVALIPDNVTIDEAPFAIIGAIALQGIRLINPTFGETVVVTGLGLIGLMAAQLLRANGCEVIGLDFDASKVALAQSWGIRAYDVSQGSDVVQLVLDATGGIGSDAVLITASAKNNDIIAQAAKMSRKRGRIVLVGVIGLDIQRSDFYEKELSFQVSCSYGPGRYDEKYEQKGQDYPISFVRWTEKRNIEAILKAISGQKVQIQPLISEMVDLADYEQIYGNISKGGSIASLLKYQATASALQTKVTVSSHDFGVQKGILGVIGAGNFTSAVILPELKHQQAAVKYIASSKGLSGTTLAKKYKIPCSTTDYRDILDDQTVDAVLITTRHNTHAAMVIEALEAGKHVFVEKPLALTRLEMASIQSAYEHSGKTLTVGFNRRFSPFVLDAQKHLSMGNPMNMIATMNAGHIPANHWTQDMQVGGGRIIGEACHYIDLMIALSGSLVTEVIMSALGSNPTDNTDNAILMLRFQNGSQGAIHYFSNGSKAYNKERIEVYQQQRTLVIDNFRKIEYFGYQSSGFSKTQDKGHREQFRRFNLQLREGGVAIIPFDEIHNASMAAIAAIESLQSSQWVKV